MFCKHEQLDVLVPVAGSISSSSDSLAKPMLADKMHKTYTRIMGLIYSIARAMEICVWIDVQNKYLHLESIGQLANSCQYLSCLVLCKTVNVGRRLEM